MGEVDARLGRLGGVLDAHRGKEPPAPLAQRVAYGEGEVAAAGTVTPLVNPVDALVRPAGGLGVNLDGEVLEVQRHGMSPLR